MDDGSTDGGGTICDAYAERDSRCIVVHQENQGVSVARNVGISLARGEYLTFVDPDDYINLNTYEYTYKMAHENCDDVLEFGGISVPDPNSIKIYTENKQIEIKDQTQLKNLTENFYPCNKIYKINMIKDNNLKFIPGMVYEDIAFTLMMMPYIKKYQSIENKFYYYRQREGSITHVGIKHKDLPNCINAIPAVCQEWREQNVLKGNEDYILSILLEKYYWALQPSIQKNPAVAKEILNLFGQDIYNRRVLKICDVYTRAIVRCLERI